MNISELARELGVAVSTVSRVLSGNAEKYRISRKTVARIEEAARTFQVAPDPIGAGLRRGKMGIVGLLVPDITNPFFSQLARAIELHLRASGVAVQLCDSAEDSDTEISLLEKMLTRRLDGMIVAPVGNESDRLRTLLERSPMPVVMVDRPLPGISTPGVHLHNREAGRIAAAELLAAGHREIGCLRGAPNSESDRERFRGVSDAVAEAGLDPSGIQVAGTGYSREDSRKEAALMLDTARRPTGIITLSGQGILGVLEAVRLLGLSIPGDLSVVAFDEQPWSPLIEPPLTTVGQPVDEMADRVARMLNGLMENSDLPNIVPEKETSSCTFEAVLTRRASVGPPPANR